MTTAYREHAGVHYMARVELVVRCPVTAGKQRLGVKLTVIRRGTLEPRGGDGVLLVNPNCGDKVCSSLSVEHQVRVVFIED